MTQDKQFVVRMWDGTTKRWSTLTDPLSEAEADRHYNEYTSNGTEATGENGEDTYYMVFPIDADPSSK